MADKHAVEYLLRVRHEGDVFTATVRRFATSAHPEVRAVVGPVSRGQGATEAAAMVAAISQASIGRETTK